MNTFRATTERVKGGSLTAPCFCLLLFALCLLIFFFFPPCAALAQTAQPKRPVPIQRPKPPLSESTAPASANAEGDGTPLTGDWAPELLDAILSSPNSAARDAMLDAAFAAGEALVPRLEAALADDRTAEFAAQSLAYIGGPKALEILSRLLSDPRGLDLKRFYYGALGEFEGPEAAKVLFHALDQADAEADRTVTEAAILALTVRSDAGLAPQLRQAEAKIRDVVLRDDLDNAVEVIEARARYLASPRGKKAGGSLEQAVRTYFAPALEPPPPVPDPAKEAEPGARAAALQAGGPSKASLGPAKAGPAKPGSPNRSAPEKAMAPSHPAVKVETRNVTFSPNRTRALARVTFEDPSAIALYDIVLEKRAGNWTVASVWLGPETEKPGAKAEESARPPGQRTDQ
jgi:hypothetical protein